MSVKSKPKLSNFMAYSDVKSQRISRRGVRLDEPKVEEYSELTTNYN